MSSLSNHFVNGTVQYCFFIYTLAPCPDPEQTSAPALDSVNDDELGKILDGILISVLRTRLCGYTADLF